MWYVIQTTTGKEQELVETIRRMLPPESYEGCFFLKRQLLKRLGGEWLEVTETLFPAYVFLQMTEPEAVFYHLKRVPEFAKILGDNQGGFISLEEEEARFLQTLCKDSESSGAFWLVKLSRIWLNENGTVRQVKGPLADFEKQIIQLNLRKRYAMIHTPLCGGKQNALLGVAIEKD